MKNHIIDINRQPGIHPDHWEDRNSAEREIANNPDLYSSLKFPETVFPRHPFGGCEMFADSSSHEPMATFENSSICEEAIRRWNNYADRVVVLKAIIAGVARWENATGELCFDGLRYPVPLNEEGVPMLNNFVRTAIRKSNGENGRYLRPGTTERSES